MIAKQGYVNFYKCLDANGIQGVISEGAKGLQL